MFIVKPKRSNMILINCEGLGDITQYSSTEAFRIGVKSCVEMLSKFQNTLTWFDETVDKNSANYANIRTNFFLQPYGLLRMCDMAYQACLYKGSKDRISLNFALKNYRRILTDIINNAMTAEHHLDPNDINSLGTSDVTTAATTLLSNLDTIENSLKTMSQFSMMPIEQKRAILKDSTGRHNTGLANTPLFNGIDQAIYDLTQCSIANFNSVEGGFITTFIVFMRLVYTVITSDVDHKINYDYKFSDLVEPYLKGKIFDSFQLWLGNSDIACNLDKTIEAMVAVRDTKVKVVKNNPWVDSNMFKPIFDVILNCFVNDHSIYLEWLADRYNFERDLRTYQLYYEVSTTLDSNINFKKELQFFTPHRLEDVNLSDFTYNDVKSVEVVWEDKKVQEFVDQFHSRYKMIIDKFIEFLSSNFCVVSPIEKPNISIQYTHDNKDIIINKVTVLDTYDKAINFISCEYDSLLSENNDLRNCRVLDTIHTSSVNKQIDYGTLTIRQNEGHETTLDSTIPILTWIMSCLSYRVILSQTTSSFIDDVSSNDYRTYLVSLDYIMHKIIPSKNAMFSTFLWDHHYSMRDLKPTLEQWDIREMLQIVRTGSMSKEEFEKLWFSYPEKFIETDNLDNMYVRSLDSLTTRGNEYYPEFEVPKFMSVVRNAFNSMAYQLYKSRVNPDLVIKRECISFKPSNIFPIYRPTCAMLDNGIFETWINSQNITPYYNAGKSNVSVDYNMSWNSGNLNSTDVKVTVPFDIRLANGFDKFDSMHDENTHTIVLNGSNRMLGLNLDINSTDSVLYYRVDKTKNVNNCLEDFVEVYPYETDSVSVAIRILDDINAYIKKDYNCLGSVDEPISYKFERIVHDIARFLSNKNEKALVDETNNNMVHLTYKQLIRDLNSFDHSSFECDCSVSKPWRSCDFTKWYERNIASMGEFSQLSTPTYFYNHTFEYLMDKERGVVRPIIPSYEKVEFDVHFDDQAFYDSFEIRAEILEWLNDKIKLVIMNSTIGV